MTPDQIRVAESQLRLAKSLQGCCATTAAAIKKLPEATTIEISFGLNCCTVRLRDGFNRPLDEFSIDSAAQSAGSLRSAVGVLLDKIRSDAAARLSEIKL